jgi:hypothetical protein
MVFDWDWLWVAQVVGGKKHGSIANGGLGASCLAVINIPYSQNLFVVPLFLRLDLHTPETLSLSSLSVTLGTAALADISGLTSMDAMLSSSSLLPSS